jgi:HK97 gp10 family phage protein
MDFSIHTTGLEKTIATLTQLPKSMQKKVLKPALRKGANVVRNKATENVKALVSGDATGLGEKSLRVYNMRNKNGALRVGVMVKRGLLTPKGVRVGLYMSVLEYGKHNQAPKPYMRPAARESVGEVLRVVTEDVKTNTEKAVTEARQ